MLSHYILYTLLVMTYEVFVFLIVSYHTIVSSVTSVESYQWRRVFVNIEGSYLTLDVLLWTLLIYVKCVNQAFNRRTLTDWIKLQKQGDGCNGFLLTSDFCQFCVVIRIFHPCRNGQWPPTSKDFYTKSYPLHYFLIIILEK